MTNLFLRLAVAAGLSATSLICTAQNADLKSSMARGQEVYASYCITCHMENGEGIEGVYPPLAKSDYLMADKKRSIVQVMNGVSGEMKVNGVIYNGEMTSFGLSDEEVSDVVNYIRNSFGNKDKGGPVKPADVAALRTK
jgi:mono/diheme cytochrome c family protein